MIDATLATLDRIVDGEHAVLLLEDDAGDVVDEQVLDLAALPADGQHEGAVFDVRVRDGGIRDVEYRPADSETRRSAAQDRLDRLSSPLGEANDEED